jgi:hypothetical protein
MPRKQRALPSRSLAGIETLSLSANVVMATVFRRAQGLRAAASLARRRLRFLLCGQRDSIPAVVVRAEMAGALESGGRSARVGTWHGNSGG